MLHQGAILNTTKRCIRVVEMGKFKFEKTFINGVYFIEPTIYEDKRGYFMETYNKKEFENAGININFVQDNQSKSTKGVLRGLHFQKNYPQSKLVRVISGEVFDVAVDLRNDSDTYGKSIYGILSAENKRQLLIPRGFAHGFLVLSDEAEFVYKCDDFYHPEDEAGFAWNSEELNIDWPKLDIPYKLSEKDQLYSKFIGLQK